MENRAFFEPSVAHRFVVWFQFFNLPFVPNLLDISFQRIQGLGRELDVSEHSEGGENLRTRFFAGKLKHGSLVMERGVMRATPLSLAFNHQLRTGKVAYCNAVVSVVGAHHLPQSNWVIRKALPVRWATGDLDANSNQVLVNTLEFKYQDMFAIGPRL